jgi:hypothetical protein
MINQDSPKIDLCHHVKLSRSVVESQKRKKCDPISLVSEGKDVLHHLYQALWKMKDDHHHHESSSVAFYIKRWTITSREI